MELICEQLWKDNQLAGLKDKESAELSYIVIGTNDIKIGHDAVRGKAPENYQGCGIKTISVDRQEDNAIYYTVSYQQDETSSADKKQEEQATVSFDCGGGTMHRTHAIGKERIAFGTKKAGGAIGWNGKSGSEMSITGVDIPTAQLRETYTKIMKLSKITTAYKRKVANLVGKVNMGSFKGWESGEVMFLGMSYSCPAKKSAKVTVSFNFSIQMNEHNAQVGEKKIGNKKGWEYVWVLSKTVMDKDTPKLDIEAIYVDQVCEYANFGILGL